MLYYDCCGLSSANDDPFCESPIFQPCFNISLSETHRHTQTVGRTVNTIFATLYFNSFILHLDPGPKGVNEIHIMEELKLAERFCS